MQKERTKQMANLSHLFSSHFYIIFEVYPEIYDDVFGRGVCICHETVRICQGISARICSLSDNYHH